MDFVRKWYNTMIKHIGFGQYVIVLRFLEEFWASEEDNWLGKAREWDEKGLRLFIL